MAVKPTTKCDREGKQVTLVRTMGYLAGPDVLSFKKKSVKVMGSRLDHTVFGKLVMKNLLEMLAKKVIVANRLKSCQVVWLEFRTDCRD
ncbi:hypothetical protein C8R43DRAFT_1236488 [Mycena crocata]|nr:hypothetical protein C8R43DRAFT_1236488 [Mycena crocata]